MTLKPSSGWVFQVSPPLDVAASSGPPFFAATCPFLLLRALVGTGGLRSVLSPHMHVNDRSRPPQPDRVPMSRKKPFATIYYMSIDAYS